MLPLVHLARPAMACLVEIWLAGPDAEHLEAVGAAALDEVERVERLLSRFDPAAEVARVNREAFRRAVRVDYELFAVLQSLQAWTEQTEGFFDICATSRAASNEQSTASQGIPGYLTHVILDAAHRTLRFTSPHAQLDLGGFGKGYALDAAARLIARFGVTSSLLQAGASSVVALGSRDADLPWQVGLRDATAHDGNPLLLPLADLSLSVSGRYAQGAVASDLIIPPAAGQTSSTGQARSPTLENPPDQAICIVLSSSATTAEVLSTALLLMGKTAATRYLKRRGNTLGIAAVGWIDFPSRVPGSHPTVVQSTVTQSEKFEWIWGSPPCNRRKPTDAGS